ncbi:MAG: hypothetical protein PHN19_00080 [Patescibacteria group bacterium]|nr:hypothetical protein [Patescibacteria group bacterium]
MIIKYENLTVHDISTNETFSKSYIFNAPNRKLNELGKLAVVVDVDMNTDFAEKLSEIISDCIKQEYFRFRSSENKLLAQSHFEGALNKLNQALSTLAAEGYVEWIDKLHVGIAVLSFNKVHLAYTGSTKIFLYRQNEVINITTGPASSQSNPMKTFVNVVSGDMQINDKLLMVSPNFLKYFSLEKVKRTLSQFSAKDAITNFKNLLQNFDNSALSAVVLELKDEKEAYEENFDFLKKPRTKKQTIEDLINERANKNEVNSINEKKSVPVVRPANEDYKVYNYHEAKQKRSALDINTDSEDQILKTLPKRKKSGSGFERYTELAKDNILRFKDYALPVFEKVVGSIKSLKPKSKVPEKRILSRKAISTRSYLSPRIQPQDSKLPKLGLDKLKSVFTNVFSFISGLPAKSKIILGSIAGVGLIFGFAVFFHSNNPEDKEITTTKKVDENSIVQAQDLNKKASDALIYNDNEKAKGFLLEATTILNDAKKDKKYQKDAEELLKTVTISLDKINNVTKLNSLDAIAMPADFNAKGILGLGGKLYSYDENKSEVYMVDESKKTLKKASNESNGIGNLKYGAVNLFKDYIEFLTDSNSVSEFVLDDNNIYKIDFELNSKEKVTAFANYFDALYVLDQTNDQIWKHQRTIDGYNKGEEWLEGVDNGIRDANSFAIDGSIYVLKESGEIVSFLSGEREDFSVKNLDKSFAGGSKIFTLLDYDNLYVLDSTNERVVVLDKNGNVTKQYANSDFRNAKDIFVDESKNKGYVLSNNKILIFEMK